MHYNLQECTREMYTRLIPLKKLPLGELEETSRTPLYYVAEDYSS